jgi:recombinational DNA repair protein RecR
MNNPVYVFACEECQQYSNTHDLICTTCGAEAKRRTEVVVVNDGAPTGGADTEFVKGFRAGQEYAITESEKDSEEGIER